MIYFKREHFRNASPHFTKAPSGAVVDQHYHVKLDCGASVQAEVVVLGASMIYLDGIREDRPLLSCKPGCKECVLLDTEVSSLAG